MANPEESKKKAHDLTVIKRSTADQLRNGAPMGRKVMLIWDKACETNWRRKNKRAAPKRPCSPPWRPTSSVPPETSSTQR